MSKISPISNLESASSVRTKINTALQDVAFSEFEAGVVIDDDTMASATSTTLATSESIKAYIDNTLTNTPGYKSYSFGKAALGTHYIGGYYFAPTTDANLDQGTTSITLGTANSAYGGHSFIVAGAAGAVDTGQVGLRATGTRIENDGTRTASYNDVLTDDITSLSTDDYLEGVKFIGQVTFELYTVSGSPTTYSLDFNYGLAKYDDFGDRAFQVTDFEFVGDSNTGDTGFNIELLKHAATGWTYAATGFVPESSVIYDMNADYVTEKDAIAGDYMAYKRSNGITLVDGADSEGVIIRVTQGANNTVDHGDFHIGVLFTNSLIT